MITFLAGVATGFFLIGCYGACVREWERRRADEEWYFGPTDGRARPRLVSLWYSLFE